MGGLVLVVKNKHDPAYDNYVCTVFSAAIKGVKVPMNRTFRN